MRDFIEKIELEMPGTIVVADMEAGLEHLSWAGGTLRYVDLLLVVVQPTAKVMMTADRTLGLARELGIPRIGFVGNRALDAADVARMEAFAAERGCELLAAIPEDPAVPAADRQARCVLDTAPDSRAVQAIARLADDLEGRLLGVPAG